MHKKITKRALFKREVLPHFWKIQFFSYLNVHIRSSPNSKIAKIKILAASTNLIWQKEILSYSLEDLPILLQLLKRRLFRNHNITFFKFWSRGSHFLSIMESSFKQVLSKNIWNQERWKVTLKFSLNEIYGVKQLVLCCGSCGSLILMKWWSGVKRGSLGDTNEEGLNGRRWKNQNINWCSKNEFHHKQTYVQNINKK